MRLVRRWAQDRVSRLGIGLLLILGMVRVPLPEPDYHNVRHHDRPGEVCEHHDHLLRWHPDAGQSEDVAVFHWHWFLPTSGPLDLSGQGEGAALHAHVVGWDAPTINAGPPVVPRGPGRPIDAVVFHFATLFAVLPLAADSSILDDAGPPSVRAFCATFAPHASLSCLLQRWAC
jgi:hypothetical protein